LAKPDRLERDQFDNDDAIYLLAIDGRTVVGGSQLVPSTKPHLLSEVLPHFHEMGWTLRPLGLPELIEGEWSIAIELQVDERTLASTRTMFGIAKSTIVDTKIEQPTIHRVLA
jgi:N-acyl-L-homoserine lactone synthetase